MVESVTNCKNIIIKTIRFLKLLNLIYFLYLYKSLIVYCSSSRGIVFYFKLLRNQNKNAAVGQGLSFKKPETNMCT